MRSHVRSLFVGNNNGEKQGARLVTYLPLLSHARAALVRDVAEYINTGQENGPTHGHVSATLNFRKRDQKFK